MGDHRRVGSQPAGRSRQPTSSRRSRPRSPRSTRTGATTPIPTRIDQISQLFDSPAAPDLCVIHSASHNWADQGGHLGEHGSLGLVQSRAPLVFAGRGVRTDGVVAGVGAPGRRRARRSRRCSDAPRSTTAAPLGVQDGAARTEILDEQDRPRHVVGFLFDGTNANVLYDMAARGEAPNVARLIEMGTTFGHGAMASLPTVTLANHTTILTGAHPGHHGILHNAWYDRARGEQIITNSTATWPTAMDHLTAGVETIHDAVHRTWPDAFTASVNEPCDTGADYSTFDFFRRGEVPPIPARRTVCRTRPSGSSVRPRTMRGRRSSTTWASNRPPASSRVTIATRPYPLPALPLVQLHAHRRRDARRRSLLGDRRGVGTRQRRPPGRDPRRRRGAGTHSTTPRSSSSPTTGWRNPTRRARGDWDVALRAAGLSFRDEGYGFLYFGA